jgi:hypothetical protein
MSSRTIAAGGALLFLLVTPAAARAVPVMQPLKPCYVTASTAQGPQSEGFQVNATGFTPNSKVDLTIDGAPIEGGTGLQTDTAGTLNLSDTLPAPFVESGSRTFTVTLTEQGNPANTVSTTAKSTALGVSVNPASARPSQLIRFKGLGFTQDKGIYAHYIHKGKVRKTVRMARRPGECGSFSVRRRQIPIDNPGLGNWTVQFDQYKRYVDPSDGSIVFVRLGIRIRLVPRSPPARTSARRPRRRRGRGRRRRSRPAAGRARAGPPGASGSRA